MANGVVLTKADVAAGLGLSMVFVQSSLAPLQEREGGDELIAGGQAYGFWSFSSNEGTEMVRLLRKTGDRQTRRPSNEILNAFRARLNPRYGNWIWERPISPAWLIPSLSAHGIRPLRFGRILVKTAREKGLFPKPLTPEFLSDLVVGLLNRRGTYDIHSDQYAQAAVNMIDHISDRLANPQISASSYRPVLHLLLARHGIAPLPPIVGEPHWNTYLLK